MPVDLYAATRSRSLSLRLLAADGVPVRRRYQCPAEEKVLEGDDILRGYQVEQGRFVLISDEELESLAPEKSRDIDLQRFVDRDAVDPIYFERAYYLAPGRGSVKAYRLLAETMERSGRAGIATFVMRGAEYLVAIFAESGLLRAEVLRFADELRTPESVGLPEPDELDRERVERLAREMGEEIEALTADELEPAELVDVEAARIVELAQRKRAREEDTFEVAPAEAAEEAVGDVIDLMEALKRQLGEGRKEAGEPLDRRSKRELYERARELGVPGRSRMSRAELIEAIRRSA